MLTKTGMFVKKQGFDWFCVLLLLGKVIFATYEWRGPT